MKSSHVGAWKAVTTRCMQFMQFSRHFAVLVCWSNIMISPSPRSSQLNLMRQTLRSSYFLVLIRPLCDCSCPGSLVCPYMGLVVGEGTVRMFFLEQICWIFWQRCFTVHTHFLFLDSDSTSTCSNDSIYYLCHPLSLSRVSSREDKK